MEGYSNAIFGCDGFGSHDNFLFAWKQ